MPEKAEAVADGGQKGERMKAFRCTIQRWYFHLVGLIRRPIKLSVIHAS